MLLSMCTYNHNHLIKLIIRNGVDNKTLLYAVISIFLQVSIEWSHHDITQRLDDGYCGYKP